MGGLFGGGSKSTKEKPWQQELNPPSDMSGAGTPGDDKMRQRANQMAQKEQAEKRASETLLGRNATGDTAGTPAPTAKPQKAKTMPGITYQ